LNPRITQREMDSMYTVVMANMNKLTVDLNTKLKEQQQAEEQERLRKIQEALEAERAAKEADEQRQREEIENKRLWVLGFPGFMEKLEQNVGIRISCLKAEANG